VPESRVPENRAATVTAAFFVPMALVAAGTACCASPAPADVPIGAEVRLSGDVDARAIVVARAPAGDGAVCVALLRSGDGADADAAMQQRGVSALREVHVSQLTLAPPRGAAAVAAAVAAAAAAPAAAALAASPRAPAPLRAAAFRALASPAAARAALAALPPSEPPTAFERSLSAAALQRLPRDALWSGAQLSSRLARVRLARLDAALEDAGFGGGAFAEAFSAAASAAAAAVAESETPPASPSSPPPSPPRRSRRISQSSDTARPSERRSTGTAYMRTSASSSDDDADGNDDDAHAHANATEDEDARTPTGAAAEPAAAPRRNLLRLWPPGGVEGAAVARAAAADAAAAATAAAAADAVPWPAGGPGAGALFDAGRSYFPREHACVVRRPAPRGGWPALASASLSTARRAAPLWLRAGGAGAGALAASAATLAPPAPPRGRCALLRVRGGRARVRFCDSERGTALALWTPAASLGRVTAASGGCADGMADHAAAPLLGGDAAAPWSLHAAAEAEVTLSARAALSALAAAWAGVQPPLPCSRFTALCGGAGGFARLLRLHGADAALRHELPRADSDADSGGGGGDAAALPTRAPEAASWAPLMDMAVALVREERAAACAKNSGDDDAIMDADAVAADAGPVERALVSLALRAFRAAASRRWWPRGASRLESGDGGAARVHEVHAPGVAALAFRFDRRGRSRRDCGVAVFWDATCTSPVPLPGVAADAHAPFGVAASRVWVRLPPRAHDATPAARGPAAAAQGRLILEVLPLGARPAEGSSDDDEESADAKTHHAHGADADADDADDADADVPTASAPPLGVGTSLVSALRRAGLLRAGAAGAAADALAAYAAAPSAAPSGKPAALRLLSRLLRHTTTHAASPPALLAPARLAALRALLERTLVSERHAGAPFSAFLKTLTEACIVAATAAQAATAAHTNDAAGSGSSSGSAGITAAASICMAPDARGGASGAVADVSPDGLHVRGAPAGFASVRADAAASAPGAWYYETTLRATRGMLRVGWSSSASTSSAAAASGAASTAEPTSPTSPDPTAAALAAALSVAAFLDADQDTPRAQGQAGSGGAGVGDDAHSWGVDGARRRVWRGGNSARYGAPWREGDVLGVGLRIIAPSAQADAAAAGVGSSNNELFSDAEADADADAPAAAAAAAAPRFALSFWLNGAPLGVAAEGDAPLGGMAPAASLAPSEAAEFNFGAAPFAHGPPEGYAPLTHARTDAGAAAAAAAGADVRSAGSAFADAAAAAGGWFARAVATAEAAAALSAGALPPRAFLLEAAAAQPVVAAAPPAHGPHGAREERAATAAAARWQEVNLCDFASLSDARPDAPDDVADAAAAASAAGWRPAHDAALARAVCAGAAAARVDVACFVRGGTLASVATVPGAPFPPNQLRARLSLLRHLSARVAALLPLIDLDGHKDADDADGDDVDAVMMPTSGGLFGTLAALRDILLPCATSPVWDSALVATAAGEERPSLSLNRARAAAAAAAGALARGAGAGALFAQAHAALARTPPRVLRQTERAWTVLFEGEGTKNKRTMMITHHASTSCDILYTHIIRAQVPLTMAGLTPSPCPPFALSCRALPTRPRRRRPARRRCLCRRPTRPAAWAGGASAGCPTRARRMQRRCRGCASWACCLVSHAAQALRSI
jgi:hypothetical protein